METIRSSCIVCLAFGLIISAAPAHARPKRDGKGSPCEQTTEAAWKACRFDAHESRWLAAANCINHSGREEQRRCDRAADESFAEEREECREQHEARLDVCGLVGHKRYDPNFAPANFVDPRQIGISVQPNPYFPLVRGNQWVYSEGNERVTVTVTGKSKLIAGVTCLVVTDIVEENGSVIGITDDWFAQDLAGNIWYCGESTQELAIFSGDDPQEAEILNNEGAWKAGRDNASPGIIMLGAPRVGDAYREEMLLGEAEDIAEVTSITGTESAPAGSCTGSCVVTRNSSPLEPGSFETKYYAPGVGLILERKGGEKRVELIEFNNLP